LEVSRCLAIWEITFHVLNEHFMATVKVFIAIREKVYSISDIDKKFNPLA
jgi:hypothetical protein